jgi:integrase/recombinase XerD
MAAETQRPSGALGAAKMGVSMTREIAPTTPHRIATLSPGTRAQSDAELVESWAASLASAHSRRNFEKTALRFLEALPAGIRKATVEDVREALAKITEGRSDATAQQYVLRVKSLLSYGHKLGYMPFNAGVTIKIRPDQSRGQLTKRIMPEVDVKLLIRAARTRRLLPANCG